MRALPGASAFLTKRAAGPAIAFMNRALTAHSFCSCRAQLLLLPRAAPVPAADICCARLVQRMRGLTRNDATALCSPVGDLKIAEVVDAPHMPVTMNMSKEVLGME